ncbi:patatin-like phospholipase family protein [Saccharicrinis aurantiacus]|uniref:patatin-like phospholipase family protein n=1 Tax=Saccharicrinis aurantiacus TaxID=1849719 RepID=UPI00094FEE6C|nr:patatin-like phospholipase family protein [Saccharicrinis aurantiacus]
MKQKIGIALSGGGFRAAAFHLGTLRKLNQMGILGKVDVISTVSGGSIVGAAYTLNKDNFEGFEKEFKEGLQRNMLKTSYVVLAIVGLFVLILPFVLAYFAWYLLFLYLPVIALFLKFQFNLLPFSKMIEKRYSQVFYQNKTLKDLPHSPVLAINSTNIESGRPFTFSKEKMNDSFYEYSQNGRKSIKFRNDNFPISRAVMASSCVPFAFTPIKIAKSYYQNSQDYKLINPTLIDGGVYDNQGIHKLTHHGSVYECENIIVSDAGTGFKPLTQMNNTLMLLIQTSELFMNRIKNIQFINNVILNKYLGKKSIAYLSLAYDPKTCLSYFANYVKGGQLTSTIIEAHGLSEEEIAKMTKQEITAYMEQRINYGELQKSFPIDNVLEVALGVGTNLTALSYEQIEALMAVAESLTELQVRLYCPNIIK